MKTEKQVKNCSLLAIHFSVFACAILLASCAEKPPIPENKFADLYVRLQLLDVQYSVRPAVQKAKVDSLLHEFNVNDSLINTELSWYGKNSEKWQSFFAAAQEKLSQRDFLKKGN